MSPVTYLVAVDGKKPAKEAVRRTISKLFHSLFCGEVVSKDCSRRAMYKRASRPARHGKAPEKINGSGARIPFRNPGSAVNWIWLLNRQT